MPSAKGAEVFAVFVKEDDGVFASVENKEIILRVRGDSGNRFQRPPIGQLGKTGDDLILSLRIGHGWILTFHS